MKELTITFDDLWLDKELKEYLSTLKGIHNVEIDLKYESITIRYNSELISIKIIKLEILTFMDVLKTPSVISFNKHSNKILTKTTIVIKDLCCEYCLKGMIEELLLINGIEKVDTNFDYINKKDVPLHIEYDKELISKEDIKILEDKFNKGAKDE